MIIAIDGYEANESTRVGIGEYAYQTLNHLHLLLANRTDISVRVYLPNEPHPSMPRERSYWKYTVRKPKKMWTFGALPLSILSDLPHANVVFSPTHYVPRFISFPRVMSIMDLSFLSFPGLFNKKDYYQLVHWTEYSVKHTKAICTISKFSRDAILKEYNYPSERVFVTYPGFIQNKSMTASIDIRQKYGIDKKFILSVGTIQPRKNYEKLIEAFSIMKKSKEYDDIDLVIVGKKGWLYESIFAAPEKYNVAKSVKFLDFVPDSDLPSLYSQAELFALVSLYEGFGLPVLEAMANKCIVVTSNKSSLPEIAGDAGIYVNPDNVESIVEGLKIGLDEKSRKKDAKRISLGLERVSLFTWEKAAEQTLSVLEKVGKGEL